MISVAATACLFSVGAHAVVCSLIGDSWKYEHIFVARITEAAFTPWAESIDDYIGVVIGKFVVEEVLKGDPSTVSDFRVRMHRYGSSASDGGCPRMPIGYSVIVYSENGGSQRPHQNHR